MSLYLLVDEDTQAKHLINLLRASGHDVLTINEADMSGSSDEDVLALAIEKQRTVLTCNSNDFESLHNTDSKHYGILTIYKDNNAAKDISYKNIVKAIGNLEAAGVSSKGQFIKINDWIY